MLPHTPIFSLHSSHQMPSKGVINDTHTKLWQPKGFPFHSNPMTPHIYSRPPSTFSSSSRSAPHCHSSVLPSSFHSHCLRPSALPGPEGPVFLRRYYYRPGGQSGHVRHCDSVSPATGLSCPWERSSSRQRHRPHRQPTVSVN